MSALSIQPTYPIFTDTDGQPLENGYVWIGQANLDPQVNPVNVYWDEALTVLAAQPIRTINGYLSNSGTPARLYVDANYSIRVADKNGSVVYNAQTGAEVVSAEVVSFVGFKGQVGTVSELADDDGADWIGFEPADFGTGAVAVSVQDKLRESVSVRDFGASPSATAAENTTAIQSALDNAAGKYRVYIPGGLYMVDATIRIPSNTYFYGDGESSVIKMAASVGRDTTLVLTGVRDDKRENIVIENMTLDFNRDRWSVAGGTRLADSLYGGFQDNDAVALSICYSEYVLVRGVNCIDGYKHSMDIAAPKYVEGNNGATYDPQPSRFVRVEDCYFTGGGDDNFTTHHSSDLWVVNCLSENPSGVRVPGNSNCFEIDDGSRNVMMTDCVGIGGNCGLQIKGHNYAPAPYNVVVNGLRVVNNATGIEIRHTGWYGNSVSFSGNGSQKVFNLPAGYTPLSVVYVGGVLQTNITDYTITSTPLGGTLTFVVAPVSGTNNIQVLKEEEGGLPEIIDEDGNLIVYTGVSPTARNITLTDIEIVAPREVVRGVTTYPAQYGMRIRSYENVQLVNVRISDGSLDLAGDYLPSTALESNAVCRFYSGIGQFSIKNLAIYGFATTREGFYTSSSAIGPFVLDGFVSVAGPSNPVRCSSGSSVYRGIVTNFNISGSKPTSYAIYVTAPFVQVGSGFATGYITPVAGAIGSTDTNLPAPVTYDRTARSTGNIATTPWPVMQFNWHEVSQNLGSGDGLKLSFGAKLESDVLPVEFGYIGFQKSTASDDRVSDFVIGNTTNGGSAVTAGSFVVGQQYQIATIGTTDFTLVGASANTVGLIFTATGVGAGTGTAGLLASNYFVVEAAGPTRPGTDNNKSLGTASFRWSQVFAGNGTINTSDAREKQQVRELSDAEKAVALRCKGLLRAFKFNEAVVKKGEGARIHFGIVAQELAEAFKAEDLDPEAYSVFCYDQWGETLEDGTVVSAGDRYGVRYEELLAFIIAAI